MRTGQGHGQQAGQGHEYLALKPQLLRGPQNLENSRGEALRGWQTSGDGWIRRSRVEPELLPPTRCSLQREQHRTKEEGTSRTPAAIQVDHENSPDKPIRTSGTLPHSTVSPAPKTCVS